VTNWKREIERNGSFETPCFSENFGKLFRFRGPLVYVNQVCATGQPMRFPVMFSKSTVSQSNVNRGRYLRAMSLWLNLSEFQFQSSQFKTSSSDRT
jgi:hypothetical protein